MSVLDQTAAFEHMYSPGRAKSLFGRHRDLTTGCDREKQLLDFEWQIVSNQMDKQRNKFKITSAWLWRRLDQLASQPPLVDPAEFGDPLWNKRSPMARARLRGGRSDRGPKRPQTAAPPVGFRSKPRVTYAPSVRSFDASTPEGALSSSGGSSLDGGPRDRRIKVSADDTRMAATKFGMPMLNFRRRSEAGEKKVFGEMRVQHLKQNCYLERAMLDRKVNEFVEGIEVYKERHRSDIDGKSESEDRDDGKEAGKEGSADKRRAKSNAQARPSARARVISNDPLPMDVTMASTRPATPKEVGQDSVQPSVIAARTTTAPRDESVVLLRASFSGVAADGRRLTDAENGLGRRPNTSTIDRARFSLICKDVPGAAGGARKKKKTKKKKPAAPQTEEEAIKEMMLGAWQAFSENVGPESFHELVTFAAKHRPKKRTPPKHAPCNRWASIATKVILAEKAVSAFEMGIDKQTLRKIGLVSPGQQEDDQRSYD